MEPGQDENILKNQNMKKNKFFKALGVAALAACTMATSVMGVYAAEGDLIDTTATGSLTITKYDLTKAGSVELDDATGAQNTDIEEAMADYALQGVVFTYLKVSDITQVSDGDEVYLEYTIADELEVILGLTTETDGNAGKYKADEINTALAKALESNTATKNALEDYVTSNGGTSMTETDANGQTSKSGLELGLYLVVETSVPEDVYSTTDPFFVSLPMTTADGESWMYNVYVYPKNQTNEPTLDKVVKDNDEDAAYADTATASEGETVSYRLVSQLPSITSKATYLTEYTFVDTLSKGLAYNEDVTVQIYSSSADKDDVTQGTDTDNLVATWTTDDETAYFTADYDVNDDNSVLTVESTEDGLAAITPAYSDYYLVVSYTANVTGAADVVLGDSGNPNDVTLTYGRTNESYLKTLEDESIVYSYGINLKKTFDNEDGDPTAVTFVLQNGTHKTKEDGYYIVATKADDGVYYVTGYATAESGATQFSPASDGSLIINGLEADAYVLTETHTDSGYSLLKNAITIVIGQNVAESGDVTGTATVDGSAATMSADKNHTDSADALVDLSVINNSSFTLPQTGGIGTILFSIAGALIVALGIVYVGKSKKTAN